MRVGEATALEWRHVDFDRKLIRIEQSHYRQKVSTTKTGTVRVVPMPDELSVVLEAHKARREAGLPSAATRLCFPSSAGTMITPAALRRPLERAVARAKLGRSFTAHGFRHTLNNVLRQVAERSIVRSITGHVTDEMTTHYSWIGDDEKAGALDAAVRAMGPGVV